jgi:hypothetical protein
MIRRRKPQNPILNVNRRTLLKVGLFGAAAFTLGKIFGPGISFFTGDEKVSDFKNFRVVENGEELGVYDKLGNEILVMEKD